MRSKSLFPHSAVESCEMLLADRVCTCSIKFLGFVAVGGSKGTKYSNIAELELMGSTRWETAQTNVIFKTKLQDFEAFMRSETIADKDTRFWTARSLVCGSNTRVSYSKLILESVYPDSEHA